MIRSMTGFGKGENEAEGYKFTVEIKAVNHRYNDISVKLPKLMNRFEDSVRKYVSKEIFRGKTDIYINFENFSQKDTIVKLNENIADNVINNLNILKNKYNINGDSILEIVAKFPDVMTIEKVDENDELMYNVLLPALDAALKQFVAMREKEGEALKIDILKKCAVLKNITDDMSKKANSVPEEYRKKLMERIDSLLEEVPIDEQRLSQEVLLFADKCCIDEEITRLYSHISQLEDILEKGGSVGRKLDFLVQELNREANTSASKAGDIDVTQAAIELKSEIEKIREQIQNIE